MLWNLVDGRLKREHGLPMAHFDALDAVSGAEQLRVGDLAQRLRITVGGASKLVDRVEAAGLVERVADPADRRASRIVLTPAGRRLLGAATTTYEVALAAALDPVLTADEQARLARRAREVHGTADAAAVAATRDSVVRRDADDATVARFREAADGVVVVDTTHLDLEGSVAAVLDLVSERTGVREPQPAGRVHP